MGLLSKNGFQIVDTPDNSDINIIFTCAVKAPTSNKMKHHIKLLTNTKKPLIVAGCLPKVEKRSIEKINPKASLLGPDDVTKVVEVANKTLQGERIVLLERVSAEKVLIPHIRTNSTIDIIQINSGCLSACSFCATKLARGNLFSFRPHLIREQIKQSISEGCREIWLTSQDSGAYGRDIGTNLPELLESANSLSGDFFVRVGMMNPLHFKRVELEKLIQAFKGQKIFKFLHLCVQSGSNDILKIMRRGYQVEDFIYYSKRFREQIPNLTLATDIIVGHPGEKEKDFEHTKILIKDVEPEVVFLSKFGARPGTLSEKMEQVDRKIIIRRSQELTKVIKKISLKKNRKWIGWNGEVLIDEKTQNGSQGRNFAYKQVFVKEDISQGKIIRVKITDANSNFLSGEIIHA